MHQNPIRMFIEGSIAQRAQHFSFLAVCSGRFQLHSGIAEEPVHKSVLLYQFFVRFLERHHEVGIFFAGVT